MVHHLQPHGYKSALWTAVAGYTVTTAHLQDCHGNAMQLHLKDNFAAQAV